MDQTWLLDVFDRLLSTYGPQDWWPGTGPLDVAVGAILTQRTAWENAARSIDRLRRAGRLSIEGIQVATEEEIAEAIRPSGCYRTKARKLKAFAAFVVDRHAGRLDELLMLPLDALRRELLTIYGVGPETADAIVLYAAGRPTFVIDAYTRRLFGRLGRLSGDASYDAVQSRFTDALPADADLFNEFHALIVRHGKERCGSRPRCGGCPLTRDCAYAAQEGSAR